MYPTYMPQYQYQVQQRQDYISSQPMQQVNGFACRPVTSRAEAEVYQIPFDGSTTFFVDMANGKIYAKTFNAMNGTAPLVTFIREGETPAPQYVTQEEFNAFKDEMLKKPAGKVKKNDDE